jgi:hypothetical protein
MGFARLDSGLWEMADSFHYIYFGIRSLFVINCLHQAKGRRYSKVIFLLFTEQFNNLSMHILNLVRLVYTIKVSVITVGILQR